MTEPIEDYKQMAEKSYNHSGYVSADNFVGPFFYPEGMEGKEYVLNLRNKSFSVFDSKTEELVSDKEIISIIISKFEEDQKIACARDKVSEMLSGNNPVLAEILRMHLEYNNGRMRHPLTKDGIDFYEVGHNATHHFYLGIKDGKAYKLSTYYDYDPETHEDISEEHIREVTGDWGYIGHY